MAGSPRSPSRAREPRPSPSSTSRPSRPANHGWQQTRSINQYARHTSISLPHIGDTASTSAEALIDGESAPHEIAERSPVGVTIALCVAAVGLAFAGAWDVKAADATAAGLWSVLPIESYVSIVVAAVAAGLVLSQRPINKRLSTAALATLFLVVEVLPTLAISRVGTPLSWLRSGLVDLVEQTGAVGREPIDSGLWSVSMGLIGFLTRVAGLATSRSFVTWLPTVLHAAMIAPAVLWAKRLSTGAARSVAVGFVIVFGGVGIDALTGDAFAAIIALCLLAVIADHVEGRSNTNSITIRDAVRNGTDRLRKRASNSLAEGSSDETRHDRWSMPTDRLSHFVAVCLAALLYLSLPILLVCCVVVGILAIRRLLPVAIKWVLGAAMLWGAAGWALRWAFTNAAASRSAGNADDRITNVVSTIERAAAQARVSWSAGGTQRVWFAVGVVAIAALVAAIALGWSTATTTERSTVVVTIAGGLLLPGPGPLIGKCLLLSAPTVGVIVARRFDARHTDQEATDAQSLGVTLVLVAALLTMFGVRHADLSFTTLRPSDIAAMAWVSEHSPHNAVVLSTGANIPWDISAQGERTIVPVDTGTTARPSTALKRAAKGFRTSTPLYLLLPVSAERQRQAGGGDGPVEVNSQIARVLVVEGDWEVTYQLGGTFVMRHI